MDRLLNIGRDNGYPLCAETLELLHNNVQLLETVLNGLNLPQRTVVRFPYGDFAYVQTVDSNSGRGEILKIGTGANLANGDIHQYSINTSNIDIVSSTNTNYDNVYQIRKVNFRDITSSTPTYNTVNAVYNFEDLLEKARWETMPFYHFFNDQNSQMDANVSQAICEMKHNGLLMKVRIYLTVNNLSIDAETNEFRVFFNGDLAGVNDCFPILATFISSNNQINDIVPAFVHRATANRWQVKIPTGKLYSGNALSFTGTITVNGVFSVDVASQQMQNLDNATSIAIP
ncbi:MAG: hypothetical protein IJ986_09080 [Bacteroidales bacterium]|nr:hypothetical protein [Bacteroidales bacterium]